MRRTEFDRIAYYTMYNMALELNRGSDDERLYEALFRGRGTVYCVDACYTVFKELMRNSSFADEYSEFCKGYLGSRHIQHMDCKPFVESVSGCLDADWITNIFKENLYQGKIRHQESIELMRRVC